MSFGRILKLVLVLVIFLNLCLLAFAHKSQRIVDAVKQKIVKELKCSEEQINIAGDIPDFKLYDIDIHKITEKPNKIEVEIKISDFFNNNNFKIIKATVNREKAKHNISGKVKLIYSKNNITVITYGKIEEIKDEIVTVTTEFGKRVKCKIIDDEQVEVIE